MSKHKNAHPLLKRARAYNALAILAMRLDLPFEHYKRLTQRCLDEYHRLKEREKRLKKVSSARKTARLA